MGTSSASTPVVQASPLVGGLVGKIPRNRTFITLNFVIGLRASTIVSVTVDISPSTTAQTELDELEYESIYILREVAATFERPGMLFSGGKDSIVMLRLAEKAFKPGRIPFPIVHVDTGHNFPEVIEFRDRRAAELGIRLVVGSVQESIDQGRVQEETGPKASRNRLQSVTLLDTISSNRFDAVFGGGRRDEDKARAKERIFSFRDDFGQWDPKNQRPEVWNLYNGAHRKGEHIRVFPISQLDRARRVALHRAGEPGLAVDLLRPSPGRVPAGQHVACGHTVRHRHGRRGGGAPLGPLSHGG